jgi:hypothetical protein
MLKRIGILAAVLGGLLLIEAFVVIRGFPLIAGGAQPPPRIPTSLAASSTSGPGSRSPALES